MATIKASVVISAILLFAIPVHVRAQSDESSTPARAPRPPHQPQAKQVPIVQFCSIAIPGTKSSAATLSPSLFRWLPNLIKH